MSVIRLLAYLAIDYFHISTDYSIAWSQKKFNEKEQQSSFIDFAKNLRIQKWTIGRISCLLFKILAYVSNIKLTDNATI